MKVLNLYAGIRGNRKLWKDVEVTAVEINPEIAKIYQEFFPNDKVIVADAHEYLLEHYDEFDFIWASPPCQTHSRIRNIAGVGSGHTKPVYPDMKLWQEIIFLNQVYHSSGTNFKGKFVVENVMTYYKPLIEPQKCGRHYLWSNFTINNMKSESIITADLEKKQVRLGFEDFNNESELNTKQVLNNCTEPELGLHVFNCAFKEKQAKLSDFTSNNKVIINGVGTEWKS
jgi:DNA (cytosine-5)-methyltransferase 1